MVLNHEMLKELEMNKKGHFKQEDQKTWLEVLKVPFISYLLFSFFVVVVVVFFLFNLFIYLFIVPSFRSPRR